MARVAFLQDTLIEYTGYMQIAAVLPQDGLVVEVFFDDQRDDDRLDRAVRSFHPDVIGFSVLTRAGSGRRARQVGSGSTSEPSPWWATSTPS